MSVSGGASTGGENRILVVCVGNICRSPLGERLLRATLPTSNVSSAGIAALTGRGPNETTARVAAARDVSLAGHVARQFTSSMGAGQDLVLVMEPWHRRTIVADAPQLQGRVMLFDHWTGARAIPDPYRRPESVHAAVFDMLIQGADAWASRIGQGISGPDA